MPDNNTVTVQTSDGKLWDIPRNNLPAAQARGAKLYTPPSATNRFVTSLAGVPEGTNINPISADFYKGAGELGNWLDALHTAISSINPVPGAESAAQTALARMKQPGLLNKALGATEYAESGIPWAGPGIVRAHEQGIKGDAAGMLGSSISSGLTAAGLTAGAPRAAESLTPSALSNLARGPVQYLFDVGDNFAARAAKEHADNLAKLQSEYEAKIAEVGKRTAEDDAAYRTKVEQAKDDYSRRLAENAERRRVASARESAANVKSETLSQPRAGPVYQRLAGMADQIAEQDVPKLDRAVRTAQNARWNALRVAVGDKTVDWTPVQDAVRDAESNILQGSPENISIFRNILREGTDPLLEQATVFKRTGTSLQDIMSSRHLSESGRARLTEALAEETPTPRASVSAGEAPTQIPFEDARGYYTELGDKIYGSRNLPGDVRRALSSVQDSVEGQVRTVIPKDSIPIYNRLKADWSQYMSDFYDADGPLTKLKNAGTSDGRLNLITGSNGANIIKALGRYARFNSPGVDPVDMAGKMRSLMKQVRDLPSSTPSGIKGVGPFDKPAPPKPREMPMPPTQEPLDIVRAKLDALEKMPKQWTQLRPYQAVIPWYWPRLVAQRLIGELLSHPQVRQWIAGAR